MICPHCGEDIPRRRTPALLATMTIAVELAEWDRFRLECDEAGLKLNPQIDFMADGNLCFLEAMNASHGVEGRWRSRDAGKWIKFSLRSRKQMAAESGLIDGANVLEATAERMQAINWEEPGESYSKGHFDFFATLEREEKAEAAADAEETVETTETPKPNAAGATVAGIDPKYLEGVRDGDGEPGSLGSKLAELEQKYGVDQPD